MARSCLVFALMALPALAGTALADPTPTPTPTPAPTCSPTPLPSLRGDWHGNKGFGPHGGGGDHGSQIGGPGHPAGPGDDNPFARFKKRLDEMSPEERQHFQENLNRWKQMGTDERADWQQRAMAERERVKKIIDDTIDKLGLKLDADQREVFELRYRQERRKIEEQLTKEMNEKRETEITDMLARLKVEFSTPKATPTPEATAKPVPAS